MGSAASHAGGVTIRVLFVSHTFPVPGEPLSNIGGMQRLAVEQKEALEGHPDVELSSLLLRSRSRWTEAKTIPFLWQLLREIPRVVEERRIDAVLFSSMVTASLAPAIRRRLRGSSAVLAATPVGRDVTLPNGVYQRLVVPRTLAALDLVMPISRATAAECLARGLDEQRLAIVPCGVNAGRFPPVDRTSARAALLRAIEDSGLERVDPASLLLCSVGRHQERKGFHWFVEEVMPRLPEDVVYLLGGSGPMTPRIKAAVERRDLSGSVRVLGRVSEEMLLLLFRGSDVFVMPNVPVPGDIEGFGVVMLEAGMCGLPIVAAELEGIRDVVQEGENGMLLPPGDAAAFAAAIGSFRDDPVELRAASERAATSTASRFSWSLVVEQYVDALRGAVGRATTQSAA